jgi:hypothetical protein
VDWPLLLGLSESEVVTQMSNEPIIIPVRGHYEAYLNGKFICSGDTKGEVERELENLESEA